MPPPGPFWRFAEIASPSNVRFAPEAAVPKSRDRRGAKSLVPFDDALSNWRRKRGDQRVVEGCDLPYAVILDEDAQA
jgi:hypothetical protein